MRYRASPVVSRGKRTVPEQNLGRMTLWQLLTQCERICRELGEHYRTDYVPRLRELQRLLKPRPDGEIDVADITVANSIRRVYDSETYARERLEQLARVMEEMLRRAGKRT